MLDGCRPRGFLAATGRRLAYNAANETSTLDGTMREIRIPMPPLPDGVKLIWGHELIRDADGRDWWDEDMAFAELSNGYSVDLGAYGREHDRRVVEVRSRGKPWDDDPYEVIEVDTLEEAVETFARVCRRWIKRNPVPQVMIDACDAEHNWDGPYGNTRPADKDDSSERIRGRWLIASGFTVEDHADHDLFRLGSLSLIEIGHFWHYRTGEDSPWYKLVMGHRSEGRELAAVVGVTLLPVADDGSEQPVIAPKPDEAA
jgi:hypothetical protein